MSDVRNITDPHHAKVGEALDLMVRKHRAGRLPSLILIGEEIGNSQPIYAIVGRFRADPSRAIGHLAIMKAKVTEFASSQLPDFDTD